MAVSRPSRPRASPGRPADGLPEDLARLRYRGCAGGQIVHHRALTTLSMTAADVAVAFGLALALFMSWVYALEGVCTLWARLLNFWRHALGLPCHVAVASYEILPTLKLAIPYLTITARAPDTATLGVTALASLLVFGVTFFLPKSWLPAGYLVRAMVGIQGTALIYFAVMPEAFPYNLPDYVADMLIAGLFLISLVPLLLGFTYYIFDFGVLRKLVLTLLMMLHLCLFVPLQYLLQACLIHRFSLLFLPLLYIVFGLPLDVMVIIAFYGWGMSWRDRLSPGRTLPPLERGVRVG